MPTKRTRISENILFGPEDYSLRAKLQETLKQCSNIRKISTYISWDIGESASAVWQVSIRVQTVQCLTVLHQMEGMFREDKVESLHPLVSGSLGIGSGSNLLWNFEVIFIRHIKNKHCFSMITGLVLKLQKTDVTTPMVCLNKEF